MGKDQRRTYIHDSEFIKAHPFLEAEFTQDELSLQVTSYILQRAEVKSLDNIDRQYFKEAGDRVDSFLLTLFEFNRLDNKSTLTKPEKGLAAQRLMNPNIFVNLFWYYIEELKKEDVYISRSTMNKMTALRKFEGRSRTKKISSPNALLLTVIKHFIHQNDGYDSKTQYMLLLDAVERTVLLVESLGADSISIETLLKYFRRSSHYSYAFGASVFKAFKKVSGRITVVLSGERDDVDAKKWRSALDRAKQRDAK